jgi:hypothetical protein
MAAPRFSLRTVLAFIALVAIWLASFTMNDEVGNDVRALAWLLMLIVAAASAIYHRGSSQAFWIGFLGVLILDAVSGAGHWFSRFIPQFNWLVIFANNVAKHAGASEHFPIYDAVRDSVYFLCIFLLACLGGFVTRTVYNQAQRKSERPSGTMNG